MATAKAGSEYAFSKEVITTPVGLISYPKVWDAVTNDLNGNLEFQCSLLVPKHGDDLSVVVNASMGAVQELFGNRYSRLTDFNERCPMKDGDAKSPGSPEIGHWILPASCNAQYRPFVVDKNLRPIGDKTEIYGGAIGLLFIQPMAYNTKFGKGVKFMLKGVQKIADGKSFGAAHYDPAAAGFKAPEVPDYLKAHLEDRQGGYVPPSNRSAVQPFTQTDADALMAKHLHASKMGDSIPF